MISDAEVSISCPCCNRDYELPRRFVVKDDDIEYLVIPRLLNCLHTSCHSCLEDQFQRNNGQLECPICKKTQITKGVRYLPLDVQTMNEIVKFTKSVSMTYCSRCHDENPSYSWCFTCHSAMCEFHHQDHKLSIDTKVKFY